MLLMLVHSDGTRCDKPNDNPFRLYSAFPSQTYFCGHERLVYEKQEAPQ